MPDSSPDTVDTSTDTDLIGTSTDTAAATQAEAPQQGADATPNSSPETAGTMLDAVQAALEPKVASPATQEPGQADEANPDDKPAEGEADEELSSEELKALSWKTQQRFRKLTTTAKGLTAELEAVKPKAEEYDRMVGAIQRAGIDNRELDELVEVGGMLKSNPRAAYDKMLPIMRALENVIGEVLPADLQERVRLGYISEEDARELNRSRANERLATTRNERSEAEKQAERENRERETLVNSSITAADRWDKQQSEKDPDWHLKRSEVAEQVELAIVRESNKRRAPYFPTAEEAVKLANDALKTVNDRLRRFKAKPAEIRPTTPGGSTRSKPAPKNTLDAINNAMG